MGGFCAPHLVGEAPVGQAHSDDGTATGGGMSETDGLPPAARRRAIVTMSIAIALSVLSTAIANIALPTMAQELHATPAASIWVVNAYQLAVVISLLPMASLGDTYGYRGVYIWGLGIFAVASLACGFAESLPMLVGARIVQGIGAAGIMSVNTALVRFVFPRAQLGRGVATTALIVAISSASGPSVAAAILSVASWHWLFTFNLPFGLLALWLALRSLPQTPRSGHAFDPISAVLNGTTFGFLLMGFDGIGHGHGALIVTVEFVLGLASAVIFIRRQHRLPAPMLPVDLFRLPIFSMSVGTSVCSYAAQTIAQLALPFYFQMAGGLSQTQVGLLITPWPAVVVFVAPLAGRLSDRYPAGLLGGLGLAVLSLGMLTVMALSADASSLDVVWRMMLCGIGFGFFQSPNNRAIISAAPRHRSGAASGVLSTARLTGQTIGGAVVALVFAINQGHIARGVTAALAVGAAFAGVACCVSFLRLRQSQPT